jgi:hypothetical protein
MGKASSNKKVARAARAGGTSKGKGAGRSTSWLWPVAIGVVVLLGAALILVSRGDRAEAQPPLLGDHWHAAYGIYLCDSFVPDLGDVQPDRSGIHSHNDGLIHIHPFSTRYTGDGANLDAFSEMVGVELSDDRIEVPNFDAVENGDDCDGEPGRVQLRVWENTQDTEGRLIQTDIAKFAPQDGQILTIAFVPEGAEIPQPPSVGATPSDIAGEVPGEQFPVQDPTEPEDLPDSGEEPASDIPEDADVEEGDFEDSGEETGTTTP